MTTYSTQRRRLLLVLGSLLVATSLIAKVGPVSGAETTSNHEHQATKKTAEEKTSSSAHLRTTVSHSSASAADQQQDQLSRLSPKSDHQVSADKKQGDHAESHESSSSSSAAASSGSASSPFGTDEYVQIRPEEVNEALNAKDMDTSIALASESHPQQQAAPKAEHKTSSADDELNAHLASSDSIGSLESMQRPYPAIERSVHYGGSPPMMMRRPPPMAHYGQQMISRAPPRRPPPSGGRGGPHPVRMPPSYITLKGKLTGINSPISQYPHPAPGYPHQGPRHLPRGAAAGYAAFRDFVRAHASKYKPAIPSLEGPQQPEYHAPPPATAAPSGYGVNKPGYMIPLPPQAGSGYHQAGPKGSGSYKQGARGTKVTVAQAYIPHLASPAVSAPATSEDYQSPAPTGSYGTNPMLAKLYGGHAPQGVGRPEYNKDYGMVIHYPQATVYTEPMTVDQLHRLTGAGISQVLAQLQQNLANGHRDESNTIRSNNHHHLGNGLTIHAKEYYAPDKGGRYVPTTAAIISTGSNKDTSYGGNQQAPIDSSAYSQVQMGPNLGAGYERVKQAVAASQERYNSAHQRAPQPTSDHYSQQSVQPQQYQASAGQTTGGYESNGGKYNGEPLSSVTNFLGSELEALYKANAAFTKKLEPELQEQLAAYAKSSPKTPLRYTELDQHRPTLALEHITKGYAPAAPQQHGGPAGGNKYGSPRLRLPRRHASRVNRYSQRPHNAVSQQAQQQYMQQGPRQLGYGSPSQAHSRPQQYGGRGNYQQQQQLQAYQATEQALNNQMLSLLKDFHAGDDQYNVRSPQLRTVNQGYPHKVLQKQQVNGYGRNQHQAIYNQHEGLEIPQGPNDQIGEIAELIEALKGTLEAHRPDVPAEGAYNQKQATANTLEDVRYLASALGQTPSYAVQVPVSSNEDGSKKGAYQEQQFAYQQPTDPQQHPIATSHQVNKAQDQATIYQQPQPQADNYSQQQQQQQSATYGQQQLPTQSEYASAVQQVRAAAQASQAPYGQSSGSGPVAGTYPQAPVEHTQQVQGSGYQQQQNAQATSYQQQPASSGTGYSRSEHSQIINHLVPLGQQQQQSQAGDYGAPVASNHQDNQPANQIAVAAPTDTQYQQAQSLSGFVDSLPTEYQELLRQPALNGGSTGAAHLAALGHEANDSGYSGSSYNATVAAPSTSQAASGYESNQQQQPQSAQYSASSK